ncbi:MAG TPA: hypothetical protein P5316_01800 [Phycisphaerae bacterium]|nr:hypothetical protein [Phycisphaerae bacterium]
MRRMSVTVLPVLLLALTAEGQVSRATPVTPVLVTSSGEYDAERQLVTLGVGRDEGVGVGDHFWLFHQENITGTGTVYLVSGTQSVGRLAFTSRNVGAKQSAVVLVGASLTALRPQVSSEVPIRSRVVRVPPARRTAWLDFGRRSGLQEGDPVVIRRFNLPIARGQLEIVEDEVSLAALHPLVGNALPEPGDDAEIWPPPGVDLQVRLKSTILDVERSSEGPVITFVGTAADGIVENRLVDIFRKEQFLGVAAVREVYEPLSRALVMEPATRGMPEVGDTALVRLRPGQPPKPLTAVVFKVAGDYCLIAAGESDGVQQNEKFVVRGPIPGGMGGMREIAELTIEAVKVDYSGARIRPLAADGVTVKAWDMAERRTIHERSEWIYAGRVDLTHTDSRTLVAGAEPDVALTGGQVVRWTPPQATGGQPGAAVVIYVGRDKTFLFVPPCWGNLAEAPGARVEIPASELSPSASDEVSSTRPAIQTTRPE